MNDAIKNVLSFIKTKPVKYVKLNEVIDYIQPAKYIVESTDYNDKNNTPVLTAGQSFILGYTNEEKGIFQCDKSNPVIIFDDFTTSNHWVDFNFKVKSSAMKILVPKTDDNFRYIYYCIKNIKYNPKEHSRQWISKYSEFSIPLPPIEIQNSIVDIFDNFNNLEVSLFDEINIRKKQFDYWNQCLCNNSAYKHIKIGEFAECIAGGTPSTDNKMYWEDGDISWMSSGEVNKGQVFSTDKKITKLGYDNSNTKMLPNNTVVIALAGQGKTRGMVAITRTELCTNQSLCGIVPNGKYDIYPEYLYYYLKTQYKELRRVSSGDGARGGLNLKMIRNFPIALPPLEEQKTIVNFLESIDLLINDEKVGIPAEINLRRKQYNYYKMQLLNFEEMVVNE